MGNNYVGTEHLLLGLLIEGEGIAAHVLEGLGANLEKVRGEIDRLLHESGLDEEAATAKKPSKTPLLDQFCRDLTDLAAKNTLDPESAVRRRSSGSSRSCPAGPRTTRR